MKQPSFNKLTTLTRKGVELGLRTAGQAPEQRQIRELVNGLDVTPSPDAKRVLFLSPRNWAMHLVLEGVIATSLRLRDADVRFLNCGGGLGICDRSNTYTAPPMPCRNCERYSGTTIEAFGMPSSSLADGWEPDDPGSWPELEDMSVSKMAQLEFHGLPLGQLVDIPVKWFLLAANLGDDPLGVDTLRAFLTSARRVVVGVEKAIKQWRPDTVFMLNGLLFFESIAWAICEREGIDVITYERTLSNDTMSYARNKAANRYDLDDLWSERANKPLTQDEATVLDDYLNFRRQKAHPLLDIWKDSVEDRPDRPEGGRLVTLFTNVTWDSAVIGRDLAFSSMHEWLAASIEYFSDHPEHRLIVRVHPVEIKRPGMETREPVADFVNDQYPNLPENIVLLGPEDPTHSYPLMEEADLGLVYTSTVGLEMATMDKSVLVAGLTHYRGHGFTNDAESPDHYRRLLDQLLEDPRSGTHDLEASRRYAHVFFIEAAVPQPFVTEPIPGLARLGVKNLDELRVGANRDLDELCDSILGLVGAADKFDHRVT